MKGFFDSVASLSTTSKWSYIRGVYIVRVSTKNECRELQRNFLKKGGFRRPGTSVIHFKNSNLKVKIDLAIVKPPVIEILPRQIVEKN